MRLQLVYPLNMVIISQLFGQNGVAMYQQQGMLGHNGVDMMAQDGTPVYATHDGFASYQIDAGGGHGIVIVTDKEWEDTDGNPCLWKTIYWHLVDGLKVPKWASPLQGKTGYTKVECGDLIGYADNTGASTGSHLHFGLKKVAKGENWGSFYNLDQNNGYFGAVDPMPYFDKNYPVTISILKKQISIFQQLINMLLGK